MVISVEVAPKPPAAVTRIKPSVPLRCTLGKRNKELSELSKIAIE
jgi:hypothetical protein